MIAALLMCLACTSHGRQVQAPKQQWEEAVSPKDSDALQRDGADHNFERQKVLAMLLLSNSMGAFSPPGMDAHVLLGHRVPANTHRVPQPVATVLDITSVQQFRDALESAGDALVAVAYSATFCGPCKLIAPKIEELSETYQDVVFLKVTMDASREAKALVKNQGVAALPALHLWKNMSHVATITESRVREKVAAMRTYIEDHK